ncbi:hypothetical protein Q427_17855 [Halomonas sp. BC04]|nr:hypothetical protein Q427_17855 [Halomonas sp. BC04]
MRLKDKTALITAAGQGIGHATALRFAAEAPGSSPPISTATS